jgi:hypothetical protein
MRSQRPNILRRFERPMTPSQLHLFDAGPAMPDGFIYQPDALSPDDEATLVHHVREHSRRRCAPLFHHISKSEVAIQFFFGSSQLNIPLMPNLSVSIPKRAPQH